MVTPLFKRMRRLFKGGLVFILMLIGPFIFSDAQAFTVNVIDQDGAAVNGFRWLVQEDNSNVTVPGALVADSISLDIHNSYAPLVAKGHSGTDSADTAVAVGTRYFVSVLPDAEYAMGGTVVPDGTAAVTVTVNSQPIPTSQISLSCFVDNNPINAALDDNEQGIGDCTIQLADMGGQITQDAFGNPLGTIYFSFPNGDPLIIDGSPVVQTLGTGIILTLTQEDFNADNNPYNLQVGEALIKNIAPGKYGLIAIPPSLDDSDATVDWIQTNTIEGTPTIDAWVKADEPRAFVEGFGAGFNHADFGFIKTVPAASSSVIAGQTFDALAWNATPPTGGVTVSGTLRFNHFSKPPATQASAPGPLVGECWVGLNATGVQPVGTPVGLYAAPCDGDSNFEINNVAPGTYQLVWWDKPLDALFGFATVVVADVGVPLGDVLAFRWFGTLEAMVFNDLDGDGFRDPGDVGMLEQNVNIRFRDGTIYQAFPTDSEGFAPFSEVFPFFKWLVVEVDFARFKATGMTAVVDDGGLIPPDNGWDMPSFDILNPQPQAVNNPNTSPLNNFSRTEQGEVLTQAMHLFLNQTNVIEFGKQAYVAGENGGISGMVFYAVTRAEHEPELAAAEPWEPGVPRVVMNLYTDADGDKIIDDLDGDTFVTLADVDNYPFGNFPGAEDVDHLGNTAFDAGDAISITTTDSWDDNKPTGCIQTLPVIHGIVAPECADNFGTWNQVRPGVFDGGYAFGSYFPGGIVSGSAEVDGLPAGLYIVEAATPPNYVLLKEEDKNVDWGEEYVPSPLLVPAECVGNDHIVPADLVLFPGIAAPFAGLPRALCDRKHVVLNDQTNAAADFFLYTEVPPAARAVGFVNNDLGAEFNQASPNFGEKIAPPFLPISFKDWAGHEILRIYSDEFGSYNTLLPSTYTVNVASPSGVSPNMLTLVLNDPIKPDGSVDTFYDPAFAVTPWTFHYLAGTTSYLDTPIVPLAAFTTAEIRLDTQAPNASPVIDEVNGVEPEGGPLVCTDRMTLNGRDITLTSLGTTTIRNPAYVPNGTEPLTITRDFGFGSTEGTVTIDGTALIGVSWADDSITGTIPGSVLSSGQLMVTRGDNGQVAELGITVHLIDCAATGVVTVPGDFATIQAAIESAGTVAGNLIMVGPGSYPENVIMFKPVMIQGTGAGSTFIDANPNPLDRLQAWHDRLDLLGASRFSEFVNDDPFVAGEAPGFFVLGETAFNTTDALNLDNPFDTPGQAAIDGFTISGSKAGGGVSAFASANYLTISNNNITGNQGNHAGGVVIGPPDLGFSSDNTNITVRYNKIATNGGVAGAGGIQMNQGADNYLIENNLIIGNFGRFNGGGVAHHGLSLGTNIIRGNKIVFNENFFGGALAAAGDGGGIYIGGEVAGGAGTGNVTIDSNLIQGNIAGAGDGGGIRAFAINGEDVANSPNTPANWYDLNIINNIIVNNVAGHGGAGISLQDVASATIEHNTIANNDSTATSANSFTPGQPNSNPQGAGIVAGVHTTILQGSFGVPQIYTNPTLVNNIIWHNRSWFNDASLNGGAGGLAANLAGPYWDLKVEGTSNGAGPHLDPMNSILSSLLDPVTGFTYDASNSETDPDFVTEYSNALETATVLDEGGNAISVRFQPLTVNSGNYHIALGSPAIDLGAATTLVDDYDGEGRDQPNPDSGADEYYLGTGATSWTLTITAAGTGTGTVTSVPAGIACGADCAAQFLDSTVVTLTATPAVGGTVFAGWAGGGCTGTGTCVVTMTANTGVIATFLGPITASLGVFNGGTWTLDSNGNGVLDVGVDTTFTFGAASDIPVTGDWNGTGTSRIGVFRNGTWYLDVSGNGAWDGAGTDASYTFGTASDIPVTGDWDGTGTFRIGVVRNGIWYLDVSGNGAWDGGTDASYVFGAASDIPVTGDWDGTGTSRVGAFRNGIWYLDVSGNGVWDGPGIDSSSAFGTAGDTPVTGGW